VYLTVHSYGQYILIPWGYDREYPSDFKDMKDLALKAASKMRRFPHTVGNSAELLYPAAGNVMTRFPVDTKTLTFAIF
jgi:Zinc carboxypeptidase